MVFTLFKVVSDLKIKSY